MLVVISIIAILAAMILPATMQARREARITNCLSNMHQIGVALTMYAQHYGEGRVGAYPPWLTLLTTTGGRRRYLDDRRVLHCPEDPSYGKQGGRPDRMKYEGQDKVIEQFPMADIDEHTGALNGSPSYPTNSTDGGIDCSYIFEMNGEPCDWIYGSPPVSSGASGGVPDSYEWQWGSKPNWAEFLALTDINHDGVISWNEIKQLSRKGCKDRGLPAWDIRVPIVRCYWHAEDPRVLKTDSLVLDLMGDASSIHRGEPPWYK
jgi:type II secretory pathway pseudopilin PulG